MRSRHFLLIATLALVGCRGVDALLVGALLVSAASADAKGPGPERFEDRVIERTRTQTVQPQWHHAISELSISDPRTDPIRVRVAVSRHKLCLTRTLTKVERVAVSGHFRRDLGI